MPAILTLAAKDLMLLWRDKAALFWVFLFPVAVAVLFGVMFGGGLRGVAVLPVMLLDQDGTPGSRAFVKSLEESPALKVQHAADLEAGDAAVRRGQVVALLVARAGLDKALSGKKLDEAALELRADPSRRAELGVLRGLIAEAAIANIVVPQPMELVPGLRAAAGVPTAPRLDVVAVAGGRDRPRTPFELSFPAGMAWGLIGCVATFALSIVRERQAGTFLRLRAAPLSRGDILAGKALACWLACMAELLLLLAVGMLFFKIRPGAPGPLLAAFAASSAGFVGLMMLLSQVGRGEMAVASAGWAVMLVLAMFGGAMMPYFLMPEWMQDLGQLSPVRWAIMVLEGTLWRGLSWREVLRPCSTLVGIGLMSFTIGVMLLRRRAT
ncbi:MAG: ABC transporter permease [Alphaproteobacteria bacterium]|nr:ABC transporter permease [Alphaproteobacteria bacterium]